MLKARKLREESLDELEKRHVDMQDQLFKLRFQKATGQMDDTHKIRNVRLDLARVLTVINEKQRESMPEEKQNNG